jgi:zinc transport system substrate-binding protein
VPFKTAARLVAVSLLLAAAPAPGEEPPRVVASIKPIHSLAAAVMAGIGEPALLVEGAGSAHTYALRAADARAIEGADIIFWVGEGMETFLAQPLEALGQGGRIVELSAAPGMLLLPARTGDLWEPEGAEEGHDHEEAHGHGDVDLHVWLSPANARAMVRAMAAALAEADPARGEAYAANAIATIARIDALDARLAAELAPVRDIPFIVFHDAYHYFEDAYGLAAAGSITLTPDVQPGARRLSALSRRIADGGIPCVFSEPQFSPALIDTVIEGTGAARGELDPHGAGLPPGRDLWFILMQDLADGLARCLKP